MRTTLALVLGASMAVACGGTNQGTGGHHGAAAGAGGDGSGAAGSGGAQPGQPSPSGSGGPSAPACPADVAVAKTAALDGNVDDLALVGAHIYFRKGTEVDRVGTDGSARTTIYTSPDLVRSYADATSIVTVEAQPGTTNAIFNVMTLDGAPAGGGQFRGIPTELNAASTYVVGSDASSFYLLDDDATVTLYKLDKVSSYPVSLATLDGVVSDMQIAGGVVWYVRDQKHVMKVDLGAADPAKGGAGGAAQPTEVFGIDTDACSLAVGSSHAYCATSSAIEQRDLMGGSPKTILDAKKSKVSSPFGSARSAGDGLVVRSATSAAVYKSVIRAVGASGDEHLVACGRDPITTMATDGTNVAWVETGKGLFVAPR